MSSFDCLKLPTPEDGVLVHGMFMDGFRWDEKEMVVTDSIKGIMNSPLCMLLRPANMSLSYKKSV